MKCTKVLKLPVRYNHVNVNYGKCDHCPIKSIKEPFNEPCYCQQKTLFVTQIKEGVTQICKSIAIGLIGFTLVCEISALRRWTDNDQCYIYIFVQNMTLI